MKQQLLEKSLQDIFTELSIVQMHLGNVGRFDDYLSSVDAAQASLDRALQIYYEAKNLQTPNIPKR